MQIVLLIFSLIIAFIAILFAVQNNNPVEVKFLSWHYEGSLALILFIALLTGALISFLVTSPSLIKGKMASSSHKKRADRLETDLSETKKQLEEAQTRLVTQSK